MRAAGGLINGGVWTQQILLVILVGSKVQIVIESYEPINKGGIRLDYQPSSFTMMDTGKTITIETLDKNTLSFLQKQYYFKEMHMHAKSEHVLDFTPIILDRLIHYTDVKCSISPDSFISQLDLCGNGWVVLIPAL